LNALQQNSAHDPHDNERNAIDQRRNLGAFADSRRFAGRSIYTDIAARPGTQVARTNSATLVANAWNTVSVTAALQANTTYWLVYNSNGRTTTVNSLFFNVGASGRGVYSSNPVTSGTWPTTFPTSTLTVGVYSLFATVSP
jgi:hypothetical protein